MSKEPEGYAENFERKQEEAAAAIDAKIVAALEKGIGRKFSSTKEKDDAMEDYSCWYDKYTSTKDDEFIKKEVAKLKGNTPIKEENYFNY